MHIVCVSPGCPGSAQGVASTWQCCRDWKQHMCLSWNCIQVYNILKSRKIISVILAYITNVYQGLAVQVLWSYIFIHPTRCDCLWTPGTQIPCKKSCWLHYVSMKSSHHYGTLGAHEFTVKHSSTLTWTMLDFTSTQQTPRLSTEGGGTDKFGGKLSFTDVGTQVIDNLVLGSHLTTNICRTSS